MNFDQQPLKPNGCDLRKLLQEKGFRERLAKLPIAASRTRQTPWKELEQHYKTYLEVINREKTREKLEKQRSKSILPKPN
jgi:hypothetical protein